MVEMYLCPSYYDDDGVLQDCKCGRCDERLSNCCGSSMDGEPSNNSSDMVEGRCSDCKEMAEFGETATDTNQASELLELCKKVYELTRWGKDEEFDNYVLELGFKPEQYAQWQIPELWQSEMGWSDDAQWPLYTSDYLLEKLPEWIGKYGDMQMSRGYMKGGTGAFRFFYGRDGQEASIEGTGVTAVSALLKLVIALDDAGVKL